MSHMAIAAALARQDLSCGERLVMFSLASYADPQHRTRSGTPAAARRAGLQRSWFLEARELLERRGLVVVEHKATGRGRASTLRLPFADSGPWWDGEINAQLFEAVLSHSRAQGSTRLLLAAAAALADAQRVLAGVTTRQLRGASGLSDTTYRRARTTLLASGELVLHRGTGGRGKTNRWEITDPRTLAGTAAPANLRRVAPPRGQRPLLARVRPEEAPATLHRGGCEVDAADLFYVARPAPSAVKGAGERTLSDNRPVSGGVRPIKGAAGRTVSGENRPVSGAVSGPKGAAGRTVSPKTPPKTPPETPPPNARAGREPQNPRTSPPNPPEGGGSDQAVIEETYLTDWGRSRRRRVIVDLATLRSQLGTAGKEDDADWDRIRALLLDAAGENVFAVWLDPLQLVAVDPDGALVIAAPDALAGWVRPRFGRLLLSSAERAGRAVRFATEAERRAFASPSPAAESRGRPAAPVRSQAHAPPIQGASPPGARSVSRLSDRSADAQAYPSSYPDVYTQSEEVS